jgi:hypothetical protein
MRVGPDNFIVKRVYDESSYALMHARWYHHVSRFFLVSYTNLRAFLLKG